MYVSNASDTTTRRRTRGDRTLATTVRRTPRLIGTIRPQAQRSGDIWLLGTQLKPWEQGGPEPNQAIRACPRAIAVYTMRVGRRG